MGFKSCTSSPDMFSSFLAAPPKNEVLLTIATLIKWDKLRPVMARAYKAGAGCEEICSNVVDDGGKKSRGVFLK